MTLIGLRNRLRREEPLRHRPRTARQAGRLRPPSLPDRANARWDVQRPRRPADGQPRQPLRPQRPARATVREPEDRLLEPNPRLVSRELLTRKEFQPATTLNLLAGAWIQFEVHDWFSHGKSEAQNPWLVPLEADDPWPEHPMPIERTRQDPSPDPGRPPTFVTDDTHWWDGSQIYGRDPAFAEAIRSGTHGKLRLDEGGLHPARHRGAHRPLGRCGELLGRSRALALALHARAQRDLRPPARRLIRSSETTSSSTRRGSSSPR